MTAQDNTGMVQTLARDLNLGDRIMGFGVIATRTSDVRRIRFTFTDGTLSATFMASDLVWAIPATRVEA